eukprot:3899119-Rhodomonas_salina.1
MMSLPGQTLTVETPLSACRSRLSLSAPRAPRTESRKQHRNNQQRGRAGARQRTPERERLLSSSSKATTPLPISDPDKQQELVDTADKTSNREAAKGRSNLEDAPRIRCEQRAGGAGHTSPDHTHIPSCLSRGCFQ